MHLSYTYMYILAPTFAPLSSRMRNTMCQLWFLIQVFHPLQGVWFGFQFALLWFSGVMYTSCWWRLTGMIQSDLGLSLRVEPRCYFCGTIMYRVVFPVGCIPQLSAMLHRLLIKGVRHCPWTRLSCMLQCMPNWMHAASSFTRPHSWGLTT